MRSVNALAEKVSRSYATSANAQRAFDKVVNDDWASSRQGGHLILQRADGRFVNIVVNPNQGEILSFIHNGIGVFA